MKRFIEYLLESDLSKVENHWNSLGINHSLSMSDNVINLHKIVVPKENRGKGIGNSAIESLKNFADKNKKIIALTPSNDFGGSKTRLEKFYKNHGFVKNSGRNKDYTISHSMLRYPQ